MASVKDDPPPGGNGGGAAGAWPSHLPERSLLGTAQQLQLTLQKRESGLLYAENLTVSK